MADPVNVTKDPWARREAWRYKGVFSTRTRYLASLPGLGLGVGAFVVYLAAEKFLGGEAEGHH